jgi:hypothetical protein
MVAEYVKISQHCSASDSEVELEKEKVVCTLHDNAPAHKAVNVCQLMNASNVTAIYNTQTLHVYLRHTIFCSPS